MTFCFLGTEAIVSGQRLERFGQNIDLPANEGAAAIAGNAVLLPKAQFEACGFTPEELERYAFPGPRSNATSEFAEKWKNARLALHELREKLKVQAGGTLAEGGE